MKCGVICYFLAGSAARMHQLVKAAPPPACSILQCLQGLGEQKRTKYKIVGRILQSCPLVLVQYRTYLVKAAWLLLRLILGSSAAGWNSAVRVLLYMTYGTATVDSVLILSVFNPPLSEEKEEKEGWVFPWISVPGTRIIVLVDRAASIISSPLSAEPPPLQADLTSGRHHPS